MKKLPAAKAWAQKIWIPPAGLPIQMHFLKMNAFAEISFEVDAANAHSGHAKKWSETPYVVSH